MTFKRIIKYLLPLALLSTMFLAACGGGSTTTGSTPASTPSINYSGTITIWHGWQGAYLDAKQAIFNKYMQLHPNVTIKLVHQDDVAAKGTTAVKNGSGPDIMAWVDDSLGKLVLGHVVVPADQYISADYLSANYSKAAVEGLTFNGHVYGVPEAVEAVTIMYNKKLVTADQLPKTTDDLLTFEQTYAAAHPGNYGVVWPVEDAYFNADWFYGFGTSYVTPDGKAHLDTPEALAAAKYIASFKPYLPKQLDYNVANSLFTEGKAAAIINGPWSYADYSGKGGIDVGFATLPIVTANNTPAKPFVGVKSLWITANATNPALDADLLKFYTNTENQIAMSKADGEIPANLAAAQDPSITSNVAVAGYAAQVANGTALPNTPYMSALWDPVAKALTAIWTGAQTPDAALAAAQDAATKGIAQITS